MTERDPTAIEPGDGQDLTSLHEEGSDARLSDEARERIGLARAKADEERRRAEEEAE
jgi:hypothetical protein